jgi:hypothetical protein
MINLSAKQAVYDEILSSTLVYLRNLATLPWWRRMTDRSAFYETELIHNINNSLFEREFGAHDIWFLNAQARDYCLNCNSSLSPLYSRHIELLGKLFEATPEHLRDQLKWEGPKS